MKQLKKCLCFILCLAMVFPNAGCSKKSEIPSPTGTPAESLPDSGGFPEFGSGKFVRTELLLSNLPVEEAPENMTSQSVRPVLLLPDPSGADQPVYMFEYLYLNEGHNSSQTIYHFYNRADDGSWAPVSEMTPLMKGVASLADRTPDSGQPAPLSSPSFAGMDENGCLYFTSRPLESITLVSTEGTISEISLDIKSVKNFDSQNQQLFFQAVSNGSIYCLIMDPQTQTQTAVFFDKDGTYKTQYDNISSQSSSFLVRNQLITLEAEDNKKMLCRLDITNGKESVPEEVTELCVDNIYWNNLSGDYEGNLYLANTNGVFCKHNGSDSWEQILESEFTPMPLGLFSFQLLNSTQFLITDQGASDTSYYLYQYDPEAKTETVLTIFALSGENGPQFLPTYILTQPVIELAAEKYMDEHPEVSVQISYPLAGGQETASDSIKALNSRLLAGKGEDIIMLDGLPFTSFLEKGVLVDLSDVAQSAEFFSDVLFEPFTKDGRVYALPARFHVPMLQGSAKALEGIHDFHSFVEKAKKLSKENPDTTPFVLMKPEALAEVFYPVCAPAWIKDGKTLDSEMFSSFLKDINELAGLAGEEYLKLEQSENYTWDSQNGIWKGGHSENPPISFYISDPFNIPFFLTAFGYLDSQNPKADGAERAKTFIFRPGQTEGVIMPSRIFSINKNSKNQEAAKDFIRFALTNQDIQMENFLFDGLPCGKANIRDYLKENLTGEANHAGQWIDGKMVEFNNLSVEEADALCDSFLTLKNPVVTDQTLYEIFMPQIRNYLDGTQSLEQTVAAVKQKMDLYLNE